MRLQEAIKKAHELKCKIKNKKLRTYEQCPKSLIHWLFIDTENNIEVYKLFDEYMTSTTWEMDK